MTYFTPISYTLKAEYPSDFGEALVKSFRETGFAVLTDHPIPQETIDEALSAAKAFFMLPDNTKRAYHDPKGGGQRGYTPFGVENAKGAQKADLKEFWHTGRGFDTEGADLQAKGMDMAAIMPPTPSVSEIEAFDANTEALFDAFDETGQSILSAIARAIGLEADWFSPRVKQGNSILRLLHYPALTTPPPAGSVRAGAHEDINVITLLLGAEEAGLEVLHKSGEWLSINPPEGALVINVGDMLQRLTHDYLPSTTHRVVNPSPERAAHPRYSMPFFLHFAPDVLIEPLPVFVKPGHPAYPPITAQDYLTERLQEIGLI